MTTANRSLCTLLIAVALCSLVLFPDFAFAVPFGSGANQIKSDILSLLTPVIGIGIIALGIFCAFGKVNWSWFVGALFGIVLIYGHQQIIDWVRGAFSV